MASLFSSPKAEKPKPMENPELAKAVINRERRRSSGGFQSTIVGSGLKASTGA